MYPYSGYHDLSSMLANVHTLLVFAIPSCICMYFWIVHLTWSCLPRIWILLVTLQGRFILPFGCLFFIVTESDFMFPYILVDSRVRVQLSPSPVNHY